MGTDWNLLTFSKINQMNGWEKAIDYKNNCIPSKLYKYFPLFDSRYKSFHKTNLSRLENLRDRNIWLSNIDLLNDPFEFKALFIDKGKIEKYGWPVAEVEKMIDSIKSLFQVLCLSDNVENNLPLWAHYANNHKGYCVEFTILDKTPIYPVMYIPKREPTSTIVTHICAEILKNGFDKPIPKNSEFWKYFTYLFISFSCKFQHWSYEKEFRFFNIGGYMDKGLLMPLTDAKMKISKIFIGKECVHKYKLRLMDIGKHLNCEILEMVIENNCPDFTLKPSLLLK